MVLLAVGVASSDALTYGTSPGAICGAEVGSEQAVLESSLAPMNEASVRQDSTASFSAHSGVPLTFSIASSPALLASPNLDSGLATAQPPANPTEHDVAYSFSSSKATVIAGVVYWDASFSDGSIPACAALSPAPTSVTTTPVRALTVTPMPPANPTITTVVVPTTKRQKLVHTTVSYSVQCAVACTGSTSYQVFVKGPKHRHATHAVGLDLPSRSVSIATENGSQPVSLSYTKHPLRELAKLVRAGDSVSVQITVSVTNLAGIAAEVRKTLTLSR